MEVEIVMPQLGQEMTRGVILEWYKKEGDWVDIGEPLFLADTQKVNIDVDSEVAGTLKKILVGEKGKAAVGQVIAILETEG